MFDSWKLCLSYRGFFQAALQQKTTSHQLPSTDLQDALQNVLFHAGTRKSLPMHTPDLKFDHDFISPPARWRLIDFIKSCCPRLGIFLVLVLLLLVLRLLLLLCLLLQFLLGHVCINFHLNFCLANSSPSSLPTSQLSVHRWTSTWDQISSVCTAGPQPGTFPAQCAPLDLNLGPYQLSVHRWTSTWDLPSSVCTAGPQKPDKMPEDMPDRMSDRMREDMPDKMP